MDELRDWAARARRRFIEDVWTRPSVGPSMGLALAGLILLVGLLTWRYSANADGQARLIPEWHGYLTVAGVSVLALGVGWEPILAPWLSGWIRWLPSRRDFGSSAWRYLFIGLYWLTVGLARIIAKACSALFSLLDWLFARVLAVLAGATVGDVIENRALAFVARYAILLAWIGGGAWLAWSAPAPWSAIGLIAGMLMVFGVARRWAWIEGDRLGYLTARRAHPHLTRIGFREDLRDEALTGVLPHSTMFPS